MPVYLATMHFNTSSRHIALLFVLLLAAWELGAQTDYQCINSNSSESVFKCYKSAYDYHIAVKGWECPYIGTSTRERASDWRTLGQKVVQYAGGIQQISFGGNRGYESRIDQLNGDTWVIGAGGAFVFTDDGGISGKYKEGKSYSFRVKSEHGLPLRVRAYEVALRGGDTLVFHEVKEDGTIEPVKGYGYVNLCPGGRKNLCPRSYPRVPQAKCSGYSWSRYFSTDADPQYDDLVFTIESGEAEITWGVGYSGGSAVRAGWVMVIDVLSAKITGVSVDVLSECREDEVVVSYVPIAGAKDNVVGSVEFLLDGQPFKTVTENMNPAVSGLPAAQRAIKNGQENQMRFTTSELGGAGIHRISIGAVSDKWSRNANVDASVDHFFKDVRVRAKPTVQLASTIEVCSGCEASIPLNADGLDLNYTFHVEQPAATPGDWAGLPLANPNATGSYTLSSQTWDASLRPSPYLEQRYRVWVSNDDSGCDSDPVETSVRWYKTLDTPPVYHIPNQAP